MKKKISAVIISLLIAALAVGCGGGSSSASSIRSSQKNYTQSSSVTQTKSRYTPTPAATAVPSEKTAKNYEYELTDGTAEPAQIAEYESGYASEEAYYEEDLFYYEPYNTEEYDAFYENGFHDVSLSPLSTFAADVDTASYANLRRMLNYGYTMDEIPSGAVRPEELINYFSYDYSGPDGSEPFGVNAVISYCPWNPDHRLLMLGLQTESIDFSEAPDTNLVLLIDVSGSMDEPEKLPLLQEAFSMLVEELGEKDRVSIVTYASDNKVVLDGAKGANREKILHAINSLEAYGSTNGGEGIINAYRLAEENFIEGGNNRVIIASDGDFNVGMTSQSDLHDLITEEKEKGIFLSVLGFGYGNYSDSRMETLADDGNGNYAYIDSIKEAKKVLVEELGANMFTVAKDVKLQIEFNPAYVSSYRQIGYENRQMAAEDFEDDSKDGGEVGAGHSVTVLYELVPADAGGVFGGFKYQERSLNNDYQGEWLTLSVRYKEPDGDASKLLEYPIGENVITDAPDNDFIFAAAVAEFSMVLNDSEYLGEGSLKQVKRMIDALDLDDVYSEEFDEYRAEFAEMVYMVR